jgi:hypothetical protein
MATTDTQQAQILKLRKAGNSERAIADELSLSRRAVTTVITKAAGTDRTTLGRRERLGLEPPRKDHRDTARKALPRQINEVLDKGKRLRREAKEGIR